MAHFLLIWSRGEDISCFSISCGRLRVQSSLYIGATGLKGLAEGMQVTTNNLANVSTIGFKQQQVLFSEIFPQDQANNGEWWNNQEDSRVAVGQVGMGLQVEAVRTIFTQGPLESTNTVTDLAINGLGYFQVTDGTNTYYTRAGDFRPDNEGVWRTPSGLALNGYRLNEDGTKAGGLEPVQIDKFSTIPPKATSSVSLTTNFYGTADKSIASEGASPYFALFNQYDATKTNAMPSGAYTKSMAMTLYDQAGNARQVTAYFDGAGTNETGKAIEFVIAANNSIAVNENGDAITPEAGDGLLMSGVLQFDKAGKLVNVAAFTPTVAGSKNLEEWTVANMENGLPVMELDGSAMTVDFGLTSTGGWENAPANAAEVGADASLLPKMSETVLADIPSTAYNSTSSSTDTVKQNGYPEGLLSNYYIDRNGNVVGQYSNGENQDLWQIPVCTFTSEYNLYREGGNLFSATEECGELFIGTAGTENFGAILSYNIENSNVDVAQEMVNMIINQRGFQSNSKVITTSDEMLRKAMELKR